MSVPRTRWPISSLLYFVTVNSGAVTSLLQLETNNEVFPSLCYHTMLPCQCEIFSKRSSHSDTVGGATGGIGAKTGKEQTTRR